MSMLTRIQRTMHGGILFFLMAASPTMATTWTVNQTGTSFVPSTLTVAPGDTVHWVWSSGIHTVTSGTPCTADGRFNAPLDTSHRSFDYVIPTGVPIIRYFCIPHCAFGMTGIINVQSSDIRHFDITLDGNQEVPVVATAATGTGTATLDAGTNLFSWDITYSALSSTETAAHFHGPALPCATAGVKITLPTGTHKVGSAALTASDAADLLLGRWYANVHSTINPNGEIRGQVMPAPLANPIPATIPTGTIKVDLQPVATGVTAPNWGTIAPGQPGRLFVADQNGTLWAIDLAAGARTVFLDVTGRLVALGLFGPGTYDERGFLGVAFHPSYATNGLLYTFTSEPVSGTADFSTMPPATTPNCQSVIAEWHVPNPANPSSVVDVNSRRELIRVDKPQFNHNGGAMNFGPDGLLYITFGDGGGADDRDGQDFIGAPIIGHGCGGNAQNKDVILGKMIRIDPLGTNSANGHYGIPPANPFVGLPGLDEIFAYGLRNPWRFSFDSLTGTLYCADVGQNNVEEIDTITSGGNYGWPQKEGAFYFVFNGDLDGYVTNVPLDVPAGLIDPIAQYDHDEGSAMVGGFVYRGTGIPALVGKYVCGDFAKTFSSDGRLFYLDTGNQLKEFTYLRGPAFGMSLLGFGQDTAGQVYVMASGTGTPFGTTGVVLRIGPTCGDTNCSGSADLDDIPSFVQALVDPVGHAAAFPTCTTLQADCNGDGMVDGRDVQAFINDILSP
jgi:glucose/arabinose dehydrogenase/plastocyanin